MSCFVIPGSPVDQTKWLVFGMIHGSRIPDPTNGASRLVGLDFLGYVFVFHSFFPGSLDDVMGGDVVED